MTTNMDINTLLYATDLGKNMRPVFRHAVSLARVCDARIIMLHAVEPLSATAETVLSLYLPQQQLDAIETEGMDEVISTMRTRLENYCRDEAEICGDDSKVSDVIVKAGEASNIITSVALSTSADLIVMGNSAGAKKGLGLVGSTARRVTLESPIPVLVVPNCQ